MQQPGQPPPMPDFLKPVSVSQKKMEIPDDSLSYNPQVTIDNNEERFEVPTTEVRVPKDIDMIMNNFNPEPEPNYDEINELQQRPDLDNFEEEEIKIADKIKSYPENETFFGKLLQAVKFGVVALVISVLINSEVLKDKMGVSLPFIIDFEGEHNTYSLLIRSSVFIILFTVAYLVFY